MAVSERVFLYKKDPNLMNWSTVNVTIKRVMMTMIVMLIEIVGPAHGFGS